jgi:putative endonuclease
MPFVYMVRCADESLYTGWTTDVERRVAEHNSGHAARYTRSRCPVELVYYEVVPDRGSALRREAEIRRLHRSAKLALVSAFHPTDA